jgi:hypothetical protein
MVTSLRDSVPLSLAYPALTCGANECRRYRDSELFYFHG